MNFSWIQRTQLPRNPYAAENKQIISAFNLWRRQEFFDFFFFFIQTNVQGFMSVTDVCARVGVEGWTRSPRRFPTDEEGLDKI